MGLQEKRMIKMIQDEVIPSLKAEISEICGSDIEWDVDFDSLKDSMEALMNVEHQGLRRISGALRSICYDDLGKEGVRDVLKIIRVKNFTDAGEVKIEFSDGVLTVHGAWALSWDGYPQENEIRRILEEGL